MARRARAVFDQRFALGDTARRHVGNEARVRVTDLRAERIFGNLNNTLSDPLGAASGMKLPMTPGGGDERLGRRGGLDYLHERPRLQFGEIFGGLADVFLGSDLRD